MTKVLELACLGPLNLTIDDAPLDGLASAKAQALLCYLAVDGRSHTRQSLAQLLWSELPEADARRNLRGVVMKLRQTIGDAFLHISYQTLAFNQDSAYRLDTTRLEATVKAIRLGETPDLTHLEETAVLYRGEFLEQLSVRQAPLFEDWLHAQRRRFLDMTLTVYDTLIAACLVQADWARGLDAARRALALDPLRETTQRAAMQLFLLKGDRAAALHQFQQFRQHLQAELGVDVAPETAVLAEQIRQGDQATRWQGDQATERTSSVTWSPPHLVTFSSPFIAGPPITHPAHFYGRERELKRLANLLRQRPLQNAAIIGPRRSGKTSLLHYLKNITTIPPEQLRPDQQHAWLPQLQRLRWIFVDFQDPRLGDRSGLLRYLLTQMNLPAPEFCEIEQFLDIVSEGLTAPTVILFDEIGVALERYAQLDDAFWESLRFLATNQAQGGLAFILSSPEPPDRLAQHSGLGSPFFNIFGYTATLGPLKEAEARILIASSPLPFPPADVDWILQESGCWPLPLQILCRERLLALEEGETGDDWKEDGRTQMAPFL